MIRVLAPNGDLREIEKVVLISELRVWFNGGARRAVEKCNLKLAKPNGITMLCRGGNIETGEYDELYIGNLKAETIREIMRKMVRDRYYDFTSLVYQPRVKKVGETIVDDGLSLPYNSDFVEYSCESGLFDFGWASDHLRHIDSDEEDLGSDADGESDADHESDGDGEDDGVEKWLDGMGGTVEVL